jgi:hypothetical protein
MLFFMYFYVFYVFGMYVFGIINLNVLFPNLLELFFLTTGSDSMGSGRRRVKKNFFENEFFVKQNF